MSDDFNKDDLPSWLQDDNDDHQPEEDSGLDWLRDDDEPSSSSNQPSRSGVTGNLPWLQDDAPPSSGSEQGASDFGMTGELPWLQDDKPQPSGIDRPSGFGMTGELPWMQDDDQPEDAQEADPLAWMNSEEEEPASQPQSDLPSWLENDEEAQAPASSGLPAWLEDADEPEAESDLLSDNWLAQGNELPESAESELSYDEWMEQQEAANRPPDLEQEIPDWMRSIQDQPGTGALSEPVDIGTGDLPSWYLGMDELDTSSAPDWFTGEDEQPQSAAPTPQSAEETDWMSLMDEIPSGDDDSFNFAAEEPQPADAYTNLDDDFFRAMGINVDAADEEPLPEAERQPEDDFLSALGFADAPIQPESDEDILRSLGIFDDQPEPKAQQTSDDDFLRSLGLADEPASPDDFFAEPAPSNADDDDFFRSFGDAPAAETAPDWFTEEQSPDQTPDWLQQLGEEDLSSFLSGEEPTPVAAEEEDDFFESLQQTGYAEPAASDFDRAFQFEDIDSLLANMDADIEDLPDTDGLDEEVDFDKFLRDQTAYDEAQTSDKSAGIPSWLTDLGATVGEVSAAALVRQRKDRPIDDLSERLQKLHDRTEDLLSETGAADPGLLANLLPGVTQTLPPAPIKPGLPGITGEVMLTADQQSKVNLLKSLIASDVDGPGPARPSAIDLTYDTPYRDLGLDDEEPDLEAGAKSIADTPAVSRPRRKSSYKVDRLIIVLIVALAVILPFLPQFGAFRIGTLPPTGFNAGSAEQAAFNQVNAVSKNDAVLVAVEYGPTGAGELDSMTDAILRHIFTQGGRPVLVSGNPVGLLHAGNLIDALGANTDFLQQLDRSQPFEANRDYYVVRYLAGSAIGLRAFTQNTNDLLLNDIRGQATGLDIQSLDDFGLIVVITERAEDVRAWAEQIAPFTTAPIIAATSYSAGPLAEPYLGTGLEGLLVGYADAYTYDLILNGPPIADVSPPAPPTTPLPTPIEAEATTEIPAAATEEATATTEPTEIITTIAPTGTATQAATATQPADTSAPSATPQPSNTPTTRPSATPTATETIVPVIAVVQASQAINVRSGPGQNFERVITVEPNTEVAVIGRNADGSWINVRLNDGTEGWIAAQLLDLRGRPTEAPSAASPTPEQISGLIMVMADSDMSMSALLAQAATQDAAEATSEATAEITLEATSAPTQTPRPTVVSGLALTNPPTITSNSAERWYGMTLGIIVSVVIITLGAFINIGRAIFRRGRK
jgi:SH3-like domain-containing protein